MRRRLVGGNITHLCCVFPPYGGGMGKVCHDIAQKTFERGLPVQVLAPAYPGRSLEKVVSFVSFVKPWLYFGNAAVVPQMVGKLKKAGIIHLHYPFLGVEAFVLWRWMLDVLFFKKRRHVLHYHMDLIGDSVMRKVIYAFFQYCFLGWLCRWADVIVVTSLDYAKEGQFKKYVKTYEKKVREIPNGVDTSVFVPGPRKEAFVQSFGILPHEKIALFVGGMDAAHAFKGVSILLHAMAEIPSEVLVRLRLVCVGTGELLDMYKKTAELYGIKDRVLFVGKQSLPDLVSWYQSCNAVVLPSINASEAFGVVLIEGAACAKPGIASDLPGVRTVVEHAKTGFLCAVGDDKAFSFALQQCVVSPDVLVELGKTAAVHVSQKYAWNVVMSTWYKLYASL